jgi:hypothetical protein
MNGDWLINSASVLALNWVLVLEILAYVSWGMLLTFAALKKITGTQFTDVELTVLALGGFPLPALAVSALLLVLRLFLPAGFVSFIALVLFVLGARCAIRIVWKRVSLSFIIPVFVFLILAFVRLGFAANLVLPLYFDSAEHYRIIRSLIDVDRLVVTPSYYHFGYHIMMAAFTSVTYSDLGQVMLLFGQIILAAIPLPIYLFVHRATASNMAAWFAVTLAAFGWFMPAHAVNWGKYPALLSLLLIQFALGMALTKDRRLLALSLAVSLLIHSRSIILLAIFGAAWALSAAARRKPTQFLVLIGSMLGGMILLMKQNQAVGPIFEPYGIWVTLLVTLLAVSVSQSFSRLTISLLLAMLLMLTGVFVPVTSTLTLLDRPLVEIALFLPLAFLGGLGATRLPHFAVPLLAAFVIFHAWTTYNLSPSDCCHLVSRDDVAALNWMDENLPVKARIAIPGTTMSLSAFGSPMLGVGVDAGIWVEPLTGRAVLVLPYLTDFAPRNMHDLLCRQQVTHIYVGGLPRSFQPGFVNVEPVWYKTIYSLPGEHVVQVLGCPSEWGPFPRRRI